MKQMNLGLGIKRNTTHVMPATPCKKGHLSKCRVDKDGRLVCLRCAADAQINWTAKNRAKKYAADREYRKRNWRRWLDYLNKYKRGIQDKRRAEINMRRRRLRNAMPPWVHKRWLLIIYRCCPKGWHVDHIVPLKGKTPDGEVCGLHVPWNLQYLTARENILKCDFVDETKCLAPFRC